MKKTLSFTAALSLALSITAVASANPAETTDSASATPVVEAVNTTTITPVVEEPVIKAEEVVLVPTPLIELTEKTYFYDMPNGQIIGALAPQKVDTTGNTTQMIIGGEWVEIYTWLGKAWIYIGD